MLSSELAGSQYGEHVVARLLDFFADTTPWPRRLWEVSGILALEEACEAGSWVRSRVLSEGALRWYTATLERQLGPDRGLGDSQLRREITKLLRAGLAPDSRERRRMRELLPTVRRGYLQRWADALDSASPPSPERLARAVATVLLDCGHSSGHLHRWVRATASRATSSMGVLLDEAIALADESDREFEVLVPFVSLPDHQTLAAHLPEWRSPQETAAWFRANGIASPPRHNGAMAYELAAKDAVAAGRLAGRLVQRLQARRSYARGSKKSLEPVGLVWIAGEAETRPLTPPARGVSVLSLRTERTMYAVQANGRLDEALELAATLDDGAAAPAVSGAWAAIESLLYHPGDEADVREGRAVAADRLASIVACSWPRAELTTLSYRHSSASPDQLSAALEACRTNQERSQLIADTIGACRALNLESAGDAAAERRMSAVIAQPQEQLRDVQFVAQGAFRRLYRQRNIVLHGGSTAAVALEAALRTAAPLVGAGLDRIVHAELVVHTSPLELAARAENSLALAGDALGPRLTSLLD